MPPTFSLRYGGRAELELIRALEQHGWIEVEDDEPATLTWAPYTKVSWDTVLRTPPTTLCGSYPVRTALVSKDALAATLKHAGLEHFAPKQIVVGQGEGWALDSLRTFESSCTPLPWVLKAPSSNNATGVYVVHTLEEALACGTLLFDTQKDSSGRGIQRIVLQEYVGGPPLASSLYLHHGHKFHARVNVLAISTCAVYVHGDVVCHVATELHTTEGPDAQITNNVKARKSKAYQRAQHTLLHTQVFDGASEAMFSTLCVVIIQLFGAVLQGKTLQWPTLQPLPTPPKGDFTPKAPHFLPAPNCFDVFGLDFLFLKAQGDSHLPIPVLLEVNGGPALEGLAMPSLCAKVCKDIVALVVEGVTAEGKVPWVSPPIPSHGSGFVRVL